MQITTCSDTSVNMCSYIFHFSTKDSHMHVWKFIKIKEWGVGNKNKDRKKMTGVARHICIFTYIFLHLVCYASSLRPVL